MFSTFARFLCLSAGGFILLGSVCHAGEPYHPIKEIPVGGEGGWDYLSIDAAARRLYVTHATKIVVIDLDQDRVIGEIADTPGVHGFALAPELDRGFSSNGQENKVSIVDLKTNGTIAKVETGEKPDAILYEPKTQEVYVFNGVGHSITIFAAASGKVVATVPLSGKPEFAACEPELSRVYCNIEDKNGVAVIDTVTHRVVEHWPIAPGEEASGMAVDPAHHRLFVGCHNRQMLMLDAESGKVVGSVPIGERVDANAFDAGTQLAFSSNGDGTVTIAREEAPDRLLPAQVLKTEPGARTMALDPKTHRIFLASAQFEPAAPDARPKIVPNTLKILVFGRE